MYHSLKDILCSISLLHLLRFLLEKAERIIPQLVELLRLSSYAIEKAATQAACSENVLGSSFEESEQPESNRRHHGYKPCALPTEL